MEAGMRALRYGSLLALLAGCAGPLAGARVHSVQTPRAEVRSLIGPSPALALPGDLPGGVTPEALATALPVPALAGGGGFRLVPAGSDAVRVVLVFAAVPAARLCAAGPLSGLAPGVASAALCDGAVPLSYAALEAGRPLDPADPAALAALRQLLAAVMVSRVTGGAPR
jgi:hypothetical protein